MLTREATYEDYGFSEDEDRDRRNHPAEKAVSVSGFAQKACGGGKNEKSAETDSDRDRFADNYGFRHRYLSAVFGEFL